MKALVLGIGLQGKAVLHDLERSPLVDEIMAADLEAEPVEAHIRRAGLRKTRAVAVDASDPSGLRDAIRRSGAGVVVCMLPPSLGHAVARAAVDEGVAFVSTSYAGPIAELDAEARERGVTVLPEMGFDPGIDLVLAALAVGELDQVVGLRSYGGGLPEPAACDNPLRYKITWTFEGVLRAYTRPARLLEDGRETRIPGTELFRPDHVHTLAIPGLGPMEAFPNGDAVRYAQAFGLGPELRHMGRYALRWPGHSAFWYPLVRLGFLDESPVEVDGALVSPRRFLVEHLSPRLQFQPDERDVAVLRVHAWGEREGRKHEVVYDLIDYRDLDTGLFAMNRTVGYTASIAAQMVMTGEISQAGVLSPVRDVPGHRLLEELRARGIRVVRRT